jgi:hypothetical protein
MYLFKSFCQNKYPQCDQIELQTINLQIFFVDFKDCVQLEKKSRPTFGFTSENYKLQTAIFNFFMTHFEDRLKMQLKN